MRFMVIVKASKDSEAGQMPSTELLTAMARFGRVFPDGLEGLFTRAFYYSRVGPP